MLNFQNGCNLNEPYFHGISRIHMRIVSSFDYIRAEMRPKFVFVSLHAI